MAKKPNPPEPIPPERDPPPPDDSEVRRLLRRAVHGLKRPIQTALQSSTVDTRASLSVTVTLGLAWWASWLADAEIALGDSE